VHVETGDTSAPVHVEHTPPAPAETPAPAEQLVTVLRPLRRAADGTYELRIELRPPELGRVDLRVELRNGVMHAVIHAEQAGTAEIVRNALGDLRARLDADGVRAGALTVDSGGAQPRERNQNAGRGRRREVPSSVLDAAPTLAHIAPTDPDSLLDVRI
jgi:flagellar hook-length control protein FliK